MAEADIVWILMAWLAAAACSVVIMPVKARATGTAPKLAHAIPECLLRRQGRVLDVAPFAQQHRRPPVRTIAGPLAQAGRARVAGAGEGEPGVLHRLTQRLCGRALPCKRPEHRMGDRAEDERHVERVTGAEPSLKRR